MMPTGRVLSLLVAGLLAAGQLRAAELLPNGRFDDPGTGTAGWVAVDPFSNLAWDGSRDADGCAGSGSAALTNSATTSDAGARFASCAAAVPGATDYGFGASILFPMQEREGSASVAVHWIEGTGCAGAVLGTSNTPPALSSIEEVWISLAGTATAPAATGSALIVVTLTKKVGGSELTARLDEVALRPPGEIFGEGFEVGAVCRWTAAATD